MHAIRIYIKDGLVQHVDGGETPVRIVDLDTEGSPDSDTQKLSQRDIITLPEGCEDCRRGFITIWQGSEAVERPGRPTDPLKERESFTKQILSYIRTWNTRKPPGGVPSLVRAKVARNEPLLLPELKAVLNAAFCSTNHLKEGK